MALTALLLFNVANSIAVLVLLSLGLGVIYGMMRVINLAHGEFLMLGAYTTVVSANAGLNLWVAMLVAAPVAVGLFGLLVERLFIRFLYGRIIDTMLATWGLSLAVVGLITTIFGTTVRGVSAPFGGFADDCPVVDGRVALPDAPGIGFERKADLWAVMKEIA